MNAVLREEYEAPVLTNEAIEVHLSYLRPAVDRLIEKVDALDEKLNGKVDDLNGKIDRLDKELNGKIDRLDKELNGKIDALGKEFNGKLERLGERLDQKIDQANKDRAAGDAALGEKIDKLSELTLQNQGTLKAVCYLISTVTVLAAAVSIARTLEWL
jgi:hypothetical protein